MQKIMIRSCHNLAHVTTAELLWHVPNLLPDSIITIITDSTKKMFTRFQLWSHGLCTKLHPDLTLNYNVSAWIINVANNSRGSGTQVSTQRLHYRIQWWTKPHEGMCPRQKSPQFHQPRLVVRTFHRQGRCSRGGHLCNEHSEEKYSCSYK